jgi:predicted transcriptional regulator
MAKIELELGDELSERLEEVAKKTALSPAEMAKFIIAEALARGKAIDWAALLKKGREFLANLIQQSRKER